jgi:hypothetical protein
MMMLAGWKAWDEWEVLHDGEVLTACETKDGAEREAQKFADLLN